MSIDVWEMIPFTSAVDVMSDEGKRLKQRDYLEQGNIPVIDQGEAFIGGYTNDEGMAYKGELPVIIFGDHTRRIKLVNQPFAVGADGVKILKPKPFYRPKFFYYFMQSLEIPSRGYSRHFQFLRNFEFVKASPEDQDKVVAEIEKQFSRLDETVASLKRIQANLKRYKAAVLKAAVEGKLTEQWRKDHPDVEPADQLLKRILAERRAKWESKELAKIKPKDDSWKKKYKEPAGPDMVNLPELPEGWVWTNFEQLAEASPNALKAGPFGSALKKEYYVPNGYKVYGQEQVISGDPFYGDYYIDQDRFDTLKSCAVKSGDILISLKWLRFLRQVCKQ